MQRHLTSFFILCVILGGLFGCLPSQVVLNTSPTKSSSCKDTIKFVSPKPEFEKTIKEVGKELGFEDSARSLNAPILMAGPQMPEHISVTLTSGTGTGSVMKTFLVTGAYKSVILSALSQDNGKEWHFAVSVTGNLSAAKEDAAQREWDKFKEKLMTHVASEIVTE